MSTDRWYFSAQKTSATPVNRSTILEKSWNTNTTYKVPQFLPAQAKRDTSRATLSARKENGATILSIKDTSTSRSTASTSVPVGFNIRPADYFELQNPLHSNGVQYRGGSQYIDANKTVIDLPARATGNDFVLGAGNLGHIGGTFAGSFYIYSGFAIAPGSVDINYNQGNDFLVGGWSDDIIKPKDAATNIPALKGKSQLNSKLIIGGSGADNITGWNGDDYIVGDRLFGGEGGFVSRYHAPYYYLLKDSEVRAFWTGLDSLKTKYPAQWELIETNLNYEPTNLNPKQTDGYEKPITWNLKRHNTNSVNATTAGLGMNYIAQVYIEASKMYYNLWQPLGDRISGGEGNDIIFGDDNDFQWSRLEEYRQHMPQQKRSGTDKMDEFMMEELNIYHGATTGDFSDRSSDANGFRLGNDLIDGGEGSDIIFGGFGKDLIIGGGGSDIIFSPTTILIPNYGAVQGAPSLYGDHTGLQKRELGLTEGIDATKADGTDIFVIGAAVYDLDTLKQRFPSKGISPGQEYLTQLEKTWDTVEKVENIVDEFVAPVTGLIPVVGDVISAGLEIITSFINLFKPMKEDKEDKKPNIQDYLVEIRDFDPTDELLLSVNKGELVRYNETGSAPIERTAGRDQKIDYIDTGNQLATPPSSTLQVSTLEGYTAYDRVHLYGFRANQETDQLINYAKTLNIVGNNNLSLADALTGIKNKIGLGGSKYPNHYSLEIVKEDDTSKTYRFTHIFRSSDAQNELRDLGFNLASLADGNPHTLNELNNILPDFAKYSPNPA